MRDWGLTVARKTVEPVTDRRVATPRGTLVFRSVTRLDPATHRLLVSERHALATPHAAAYPGTPGRGFEDRIVTAASRRVR